jgi:probable rRNA maturation factor
LARRLLVTNESGHRLSAAIREAMEAAAGGALAAGGLTGDLSRVRVDLTLVTDEDLRELSRQYLGVDHYTDVMSFSQLEGDDIPVVRGGPRVSLLGDIIISYDRAVEQAARAGHPLATELALLVAHGVLHLLGNGDETASDADLMRQRERQALSYAGICLQAPPDPPRPE